ncbi:MAG: FAD-dependent oxidoreductase, partial [Pseudomonadota bacterium]
MAEFDFDLFVIGAGSGGVRAARISAQHGAKVGVAEEYRYGGTCVIRGCVPKKLMVYASSFSDAFEDAAGFGWTVGQTSFDWSKLIANKDTEIDRLEGIYGRLMDGAGVTHHKQRAVVVDPHTVRLADGQTFSTKYILVATGGTPFVPEFPGSELAITSNEIFHLDQMPKRAVIVGGGYIASEFAGILNGLGAEVTQVYRRDLILRGFDDEVRQHVWDEMAAKGIAFRYNTDITALRKEGDHL